MKTVGHLNFIFPLITIILARDPPLRLAEKSDGPWWDLNWQKLSDPKKPWATLNIEVVDNYHKPKDVNIDGNTDDCSCGIENPQAGSSGNVTKRIVNGAETEQHKYPWMAFLHIVRGNKGGQCGASLVQIGDRLEYALTAAHCADGRKDKFLLYFGCHNSGSRLTQCVKREANATVHRLWLRTTLRNDIALLKFEPLECSTNIRPICLPTSNLRMTDQKAKLTGWGLTSSKGRPSPTLQEAEMQIRSDTYCTSVCVARGMPYQVGPHICTKDTNRKSACFGDSGGPLSVKDQNGIVKQVGIVSFGPRTCGYPNVFANLKRYLNWIARRTGSSGESSEEDQHDA